MNLTSYANQLVALQSINNDAVFFNGKQPSNYLNLLLHLSRYSNLLLTVTGPQQSGKTHLKNKFISQLDSGVTLLNLNAATSNTATSLLEALGKKLELDPLVSSDQNFVLEEIQNFCANLNEEGGSFLIVIDQAEALTPDAVNLVIKLANLSDTNLRPHLALFGEPQIIQQLSNSELKTDYEKVAHHLPLEAFTLEQSRAYLEHRCQSVGIEELPLSPEDIEALHNQSKGLPGELNLALLEKLSQLASTNTEPLVPSKPTKQPKKAAKAKKSVKQAKNKPHKAGLPLWLIASITLALALFVVTLLYQDELFISADSAIEEEEDWQPPALKLLDKFEQQQAAKQAEQNVEELAPETTEQEELTKTATQTNEIIEPEPALDLPDDTPVAATSTSKPANLPAKQEAAPKAVTTTKQPTAQASLQDQGFKKEASLMAKPANNFTLQLVAGQDEAKIQAFINQQTRQAQANISYFETRRNGKPWYVSVYGEFPSIAAARSAITSLDTSLQQLGPWAKSFAKVHEEIKEK